jgi:hypothetical protein
LLIDAVTGGNGLLRAYRSADFQDLLFGQFRPAVQGAAVVRITTLFVSVSRIIGPRS